MKEEFPFCIAWTWQQPCYGLNVEERETLIELFASAFHTFTMMEKADVLKEIKLWCQNRQSFLVSDEDITLSIEHGFQKMFTCMDTIKLDLMRQMCQMCTYNERIGTKLLVE